MKAFKNILVVFFPVILIIWFLNPSFVQAYPYGCQDCPHGIETIHCGPCQGTDCLSGGFLCSEINFCKLLPNEDGRWAAFLSNSYCPAEGGWSLPHPTVPEAQRQCWPQNPFEDEGWTAAWNDNFNQCFNQDQLNCETCYISSPPVLYKPYYEYNEGFSPVNTCGIDYRGNVVEIPGLPRGVYPRGAVCHINFNFSGQTVGADTFWAIKTVSRCGDGIIEAREECEGDDLRSMTCLKLGYTGGELACVPDSCQFDTSRCWICGNGIVDPDEECDDGNVIESDGCDNNCKISAVNCSEICKPAIGSGKCGGTCGSLSCESTFECFQASCQGPLNPACGEMWSTCASAPECALCGNGVCDNSLSAAIKEDCVSCPQDCGGCPEQFVRGDVDGDGTINIGDAVKILRYLFSNNKNELIGCLDAADANDDGMINIADPIALLDYLFRGNLKALPEPHKACGFDSTPDNLSCQSSPVYCK